MHLAVKLTLHCTFSTTNFYIAVRLFLQLLNCSLPVGLWNDFSNDSDRTEGILMESLLERDTHQLPR